MTFGFCLGQLILQKRKALGLTQIQLSEDAYLSPNFTRRISELENGLTKNPHPKTIDPLINTLGITEEEIENCAKTAPARDARILDEAYKEAEKLLAKLTQKFDMDFPEASYEELELFLKEKAEEWKSLKKRITEIQAPIEKITEFKEQAILALDNADFDQVDEFLMQAEEMQLIKHTLSEIRKQAEIRVTRADVKLIQSKLSDAAELYLSAAEFFKPFSEKEMIAHLSKSAGRVYEITRRSYDNYYPVAEELLKRAFELDIAKEDNEELASLHYKSALIYRNKALALENPDREEARAIALQHCRSSVKLFGISNSFESFTARICFSNCLLDESNEKNDKVAINQAIDILKSLKQEMELLTDYDFLLAHVCNNLGAALSSQRRIEGTEDTQEDLEYLLKIFSNAVEVSTRTYDLENFSAANINLAIHSTALADLIEDEPRKALFLRLRAISGFMTAIETYPEHLFPDQFAEASFLLARVLLTIARASEIFMQEVYMARALNHLKASEQIYSFERNATRWLEIQLMAGMVFMYHSNIDEEAELHDLQEAKLIYEQIKQKFTENLNSENLNECNERLNIINDRLDELGMSDARPE